MERPTLPTPPEMPAKPRGSCLVYLGVLFAIAGMILLSLLMIGYFWPFLVGLVLFAIIGLQYVIWGWWFERIYRTPLNDAAGDNTRDQHRI